jgi:hypothetical protein
MKGFIKDEIPSRWDENRMTHDELLIEINRRLDVSYYNGDPQSMQALRAVVELHKPLPIVNGNGAANCCWCQIAGIRETPYPCPTIQAIEKELR